jgi:ribosomal protein S27AE
MTEAQRCANKKYYDAHRAKRNEESSRQYYLHRQERSEKCRAYYAAHKEDILACKKSHYSTHKSVINMVRRKKPYEDVLAVIVDAPQKTKDKAHEAVRNALDKGLIIDAYSCERCGFVGRLCAHHINYYRPLDVIWLCGKCHNAIHGNERRRGK